MSPALAQETVLFWGFACLRLLALFFVAPPFAQPHVPVRMRGALAVVCTFALVRTPAAPLALAEAPVGALLVGALQEVLVGIVLGFAVRLVFAAFSVLGELLSVQGGIGAATLIDPMSGASSGALGALLQLFALIVFLALDGHHVVMRAAAQSYVRFPIGGGGPDAGSLGTVLQLAGAVFEIAARLAAPVTAATLLANVALGVLGRLVPQLNLMMLQIPAYVALTFALLALGATILTEGTRASLLGFVGRGLSALVGAG